MAPRYNNDARNFEIVRRHVAGAGMREIAREMRLSPSTVAGVLYRAGRTKPTPGKGRGNGAPPEAIERAIEIAGRKGVGIASRLTKVTESAIYYHRRKRAA